MRAMVSMLVALTCWLVAEKACGYDAVNHTTVGAPDPGKYLAYLHIVWHVLVGYACYLLLSLGKWLVGESTPGIDVEIEPWVDCSCCCSCCSKRGEHHDMAGVVRESQRRLGASAKSARIVPEEGAAPPAAAGTGNDGARRRSGETGRLESYTSETGDVIDYDEVPCCSKFLPRVRWTPVDSSEPPRLEQQHTMVSPHSPHDGLDGSFLKAKLLDKPKRNGGVHVKMHSAISVKNKATKWRSQARKRSQARVGAAENV